MLIKHLSPPPAFDITVPRMGQYIRCPHPDCNVTTRMGWVIGGVLELECWSGHRYPPTLEYDAAEVMLT